MPNGNGGNSIGGHEIGVDAPRLARQLTRYPVRDASALTAAMEIDVAPIPGIGVGLDPVGHSNIRFFVVGPDYTVAAA